MEDRITFAACIYRNPHDLMHQLPHFSIFNLLQSVLSHYLFYLCTWFRVALASWYCGIPGIAYHCILWHLSLPHWPSHNYCSHTLWLRCQCHLCSMHHLALCTRIHRSSVWTFTYKWVSFYPFSASFKVARFHYLLWRTGRKLIHTTTMMLCYIPHILSITSRVGSRDTTASTNHHVIVAIVSIPMNQSSSVLQDIGAQGPDPTSCFHGDP